MPVLDHLSDVNIKNFILAISSIYSDREWPKKKKGKKGHTDRERKERMRKRESEIMKGMDDWADDNILISFFPTCKYIFLWLYRTACINIAF